MTLVPETNSMKKMVNAKELEMIVYSWMSMRDKTSR